MPGRFDIGGYLEKLTRRARGGRPAEGADLGDGRGADHPGDDAAPVGAESAIDAGAEPSAASGGGGSAGRLGGALKGALDKGRSGAKHTADRVAGTAKKVTGRSKQPELPPEGSVTIEYSPRQDGDPDPGEVVWAWVPFEEDASQGKDRPVVIIGRRGSKLVGVPLTTKPNDREAQLNMGTGGWDPKRRTSYARIWRMLDIDPDGARREGAVLDVQRFEALVVAVDKYYDVVVPKAQRSKRRTTPTDDYDY
jgi:hypothetical protein